MAKQTPYPISGTVALASTAVSGARIWAIDITEGTITTNSVADIHLFHTDSDGKYLLDLGNLTTAYANGDTVRVYCDYGRWVTYADITVNTFTGFSTQNFSITSKSGLSDGLTDTLDSKGRFGFVETRGPKVGMKDGMA